MNNFDERNINFKKIQYVDVPRLHGKLAVTRAIGNYDIEVNCVPHIEYLSNDKYNKIVMCTDGVYKKFKINTDISARKK